MRRLGALLFFTLLLSLPAPAPAHAATSTTGSCVDGGGLVWNTKVIWSGTYRASDGTTKVAVDYAGWTTTLGSVATDSTVRTYDSSGRLLRSLSRTATVDYRQGTVYSYRNPVNPPLGGRVVITVGRDGDGKASCSVTHRQGSTADPVVAAVGDLVCQPGAAVTATTCQHQAVADSIAAARPAAFLALGDNQYDAATLADFRSAYHPSYGRLKSITHPIPGNHEYKTAGAAGYFDYFGTAAGYRSRGYYSFDIGSWHVIALNSERDYGWSGAQVAWLKQDLAAHRNSCVLAYWHKPRFSSGLHGNNASTAPFFDTLLAGGADLVLGGHDHNYERFAPQTGSGAASASGLTSVVVGTGGKTHYGQGTLRPNSVARNFSTFGWLKLTLRPTAADLQFVPVGGTFVDRARITC